MPALFTPRTPQPTSSYLSDSECDSDYSLSSCEEDEHTDKEFNKMSEEETDDIKYLSIFDTHQDFDEEIMTTNDVAALKKWNQQWLKEQKRVTIGVELCTKSCTTKF